MWLQGSAEEDSDWRQMVRPEVYTFQDLKCGIPQEVTIQIFAPLYKYSHLAFEAQTEVFQGHVELFK